MRIGVSSVIGECDIVLLCDVAERYFDFLYALELEGVCLYSVVQMLFDCGLTLFYVVLLLCTSSTLCVRVPTDCHHIGACR